MALTDGDPETVKVVTIYSRSPPEQIGLPRMEYDTLIRAFSFGEKVQNTPVRARGGSAIKKWWEYFAVHSGIHRTPVRAMHAERRNALLHDLSCPAIIQLQSISWNRSQPTRALHTSTTTRKKEDGLIQSRPHSRGLLHAYRNTDGTGQSLPCAHPCPSVGA